MLRIVSSRGFLETFVAVGKARAPNAAQPSKRLTNRNSRGNFTGRSADLTQSSAYTPCMGFGMAHSFLGFSIEQALAKLTEMGF